MAKSTKVLSHIIRHADWPHVQVSYVQHVTVDGTDFDKPSEMAIDTPAVMKAAKALEDAVLKAIGGERSNNAWHSPARQKLEAARAEMAAKGGTVIGEPLPEPTAPPRQRAAVAPTVGGRKVARRKGVRKQGG